MEGTKLTAWSGNTYTIKKAITEGNRPNANVYLCENQNGQLFVAKHFYQGKVAANIGFNKYNHYGRRRDGSHTVFYEIKDKAEKYDFLVKHIDRIRYKKTWIIVQEYIDGLLLSTYLEQNKDSPEKLKEASIALAKTLSKWHSNKFAHGDGHLDNAIVQAFENGIKIKLIDYSLLHHPDFFYCKHIGCFDSYDRFSEDLKNDSSKLGNGFLDGLKIMEKKLGLDDFLSENFLENYSFQGFNSVEWIKDKTILTERYFEVLNMNNIYLFGLLKENLEEVEPIYPLVEFILSRFEAITLLITNDLLWDAEIVFRSALETFVKLMFISSADEEEQPKRLDEYWNLLAEISSLKMSEQAKRNLTHFTDNEVNRLAFSPLVLPEDLETELRAKWSKSDRQRLEQKWSFTEMVLILSRKYSDNPSLSSALINLLHSYRMSSHVTHGDENGVLIIRERLERSAIDQEVANAGHYLRLLGDCVLYCALTGFQVATFLKQIDKSRFFFDSYRQLNDIEILFRKYHGRVFDDEYYDKYRAEGNSL